MERSTRSGDFDEEVLEERDSLEALEDEDDLVLPPEKYKKHRRRYSPPPHPHYGFNNQWLMLASHHFESLERPPVKGTPETELVPEPHNRVDPTAVAVFDRGRRAGYIPAERAGELHDVVRAWNHRGYSVVVDPAEGRSGAKIPYFDYYIEFYTRSGLVEELNDFIDDIVESETDILMRRGFTLYDEDIVFLRKFKHMLPSLHWPEYHSYEAGGFRRYGTIISQLYIPPALRWEMQLRRDQFEQLRGMLAEVQQRDRDLSILRRFHATHSVTVVAEELNMSTSTVYAALNRHGAPHKRLAEERLKQRDAEIVRRFDDSESQMAISRSLGINQSTVSSVLRRAGRTSGHPSNEQSALNRAERALEMAQLQQHGCTRRQVADRFDVSIDTVKFSLKDGRFYLDPRSFPDRLQAAREAPDPSGSHNQKLTQAMKDRRVLSHLKPSELSDQ